MAHFAQIDENNIVVQVIVVADEHETNGSEWCHNLLGGTWIQTSYNNNIRKNYAAIGCAYDPVRDEFVTSQPHASWSLDSNNDWQAPTPKPEGNYRWDESTLAWVELLPPPPAG
jgi:hypothetical protein